MKRTESAVAMAFGVIFIALAVAVAVEAVARKLLSLSLQGVDELSGYCLAVGGGLSFTAALLRGAHIRIDIVHEHLPRPLRIVLNVVSVLSLGVGAAALLVMAWGAFADSVEYGSVVQSPWATPLRYPQAVWLAALSVFAAIAAAQTLRLARWLLQSRWGEIDRRLSPLGAKDELAEEVASLQSRGAVAALEGDLRARP